MTETVKILMLGEGGVGKSSLLFRYVDEKFSENIQATLGVEFKQKHVQIDNRNVQVQVWDTAGQERFKTITPIYYRNVQGVSLVYSMIDKKSFKQVKNWIDNLKELSDFSQLSVVIVANKSDMNQKEVSTEEGRKLGEELNVKYYECSAKTGFNVKEMFEDITKQIISKKILKNNNGLELKSNNKKVQNQDNQNDNNKCC